MGFKLAIIIIVIITRTTTTTYRSKYEVLLPLTSELQCVGVEW